MSSYVIFTDADSDMQIDMVKQLGVGIQPMRFTLNGTEYYNWLDERDITNADFYRELRAGGQTSTSQTNTNEYADTFRPALQAGKDVLYIGFSSGLSGTVNAAAMAIEDLEKEFPGREVVVVDSLSASLGQCLLVQMAAIMQQEGKTLHEVADWLRANCGKLAHWFTVDDLQFLKRGGRITGTAAFMGSMLNIKPVMNVDENGKLHAVDKVRGRKNSLLRLVEEAEKAAVKPQENIVYVAHADCPEDAAFVADEIQKRLAPKEIVVQYIGPVIGGHAGPNTVAIAFFADKR